MSDQKPINYASLGTKVDALEGDFRELKATVVDLNVRVENSLHSLGQEMRQAINGLSNQFTERQRTPWSVLITGAGFIVVVLGVYNALQMNPVLQDIKDLKTVLVPRVEIDARAAMNDRRFSNLEQFSTRLEGRRYQEFRDEIRRLQEEVKRLDK